MFWPDAIDVTSNELYTYTDNFNKFIMLMLITIIVMVVTMIMVVFAAIIVAVSI